jgi:large subunit ribosomal protein L40e
MLLNVQIQGGAKFSIETDISATTEEVKGKIQNENGIAFDQQSLIYEGKQLEDGRTLSDYNVRAGGTILVVKPRA